MRTQTRIVLNMRLGIPELLTISGGIYNACSFSECNNFDNSDPRILTVLVIGSDEKVQSYIWSQHQNGVAAIGDWSWFLPVPNCPGKVMSILNKTIP